jgi:hypothetical protein
VRLNFSTIRNVLAGEMVFRSRVFMTITSRSVLGTLLFGLILQVPVLAQSECMEVVADEEYHCPYRAIPKGSANLLYLDTQTQWRHATDMYQANDRGVAILEPLTQWGWLAGPLSTSPDLERLIVARSRPSCPSDPQPGPGLACSYGAVIPWLAEHRPSAKLPSEDAWIHINLLRRYASGNAVIHGWSTWLHRDLALFNGLVAAPDSPLVPDNCPQSSKSDVACDAQAYAIRFDDENIVIEPYAKELLWQPNSLTGRISAQPPREADRCFDGQRLTVVRRHYDDADLSRNWAWFNTRNADGTGGPCRQGLPSARIPVLRTYVIEVDAACRPRTSLSELSPVRIPPDQPIHRQLSLDQEWGDMLAAISPGGEHVVVASNLGDPSRPNDNCAAFEVNLRDPGDPQSGVGLRLGHVCRLGPGGVCAAPALRLPTPELPPHTALPSFFTPAVPMPGIDRSIVYSLNWKTATVQTNRIARVDMSGDDFVSHVVILDHADYGHPFTSK